MAVDARLRGDVAGFAQHDVAALTAEDSSTLDGTYGPEEEAVLGNVRTRIGEIEAALIAAGVLPAA